MIKEGIFAGALLAFTMSFDDFVISYFVSGNGVKNISIVVYNMTKRINPTEGSEWISAAPQTEPAGTTVLEAENAALRAALDREREIANDLMADRDAWKQQATALLAAPQKRRRWWQW